MATGDNFIVAFELGSTKITGIAGRKQPDGALQVIAFAQEPSASFIRKGRINNIIKMKACIKGIKEKLEKTLKKSIDKTYVGIGGMGMHTVANSVLKNFPEKQIISREIVESIQNENSLSLSGERDILDAIIQEYKIGAQTHQDDPVGIPAESIEGRFLNVVMKKEVRENILECFEDADLEVVGLPITTLALADELVPEPERHSGCVFVDMGAETTSVAIYKNNILRHLAVIPLGGKNITRDITSLSIEEAEAERLKINFGCAIYDNAEERHEPISTDSGRAIAFEEFSGLIEARQEEIIKNIRKQIEISKYDVNQLLGGIIITGGAANMRNLEKAIEKHTGISKIQIKKQIHTQLRLANGVQNINRDGNANAILALLQSGEENCCGGDLGSDDGDIFKNREELKKKKEQDAAAAAAAAEAERIAKEEAAKKAQEEAEREAAIQAAKEAKEAKKRARKERWGRFFGKLKDTANRLVSEEENTEE